MHQQIDVLSSRIDEAKQRLVRLKDQTEVIRQERAVVCECHLNLFILVLNTIE